jgi:hypothetical protein
LGLIITIDLDFREILDVGLEEIDFLLWILSAYRLHLSYKIECSHPDTEHKIGRKRGARVRPKI